MSKTIIYYTSNKEKPEFENKVIENILKVSNRLPIISVSQKPMNFGRNICVGELEHCYQNAFKQVLRGLLEAETEFVCMAESDCLYPPNYFDFEPIKKNVIYTYDNVWLMWNRENRTRFYKHGTTAGSIIASRNYYLSLFENGIPNFNKAHWEYFTGLPLINVKTRQGVSFGTTLQKGINPIKSFPYWGDVEQVKKNYEIK